MFKPCTRIVANSALDTGKLGLKVRSGYPEIIPADANLLIALPAQKFVDVSENWHASGAAAPVGAQPGTSAYLCSVKPDIVEIVTGVDCSDLNTFVTVAPGIAFTGAAHPQPIDAAAPVEYP